MDSLYTLVEERAPNGNYSFELDFEGDLPDGDLIDDVTTTVTDNQGNNVSADVLVNVNVIENTVTVNYETPDGDNDYLFRVEATSLALAPATQFVLVRVLTGSIFV